MRREPQTEQSACGFFAFNGALDGLLAAALAHVKLKKRNVTASLGEYNGMDKPLQAAPRRA